MRMILILISTDTATTSATATNLNSRSMGGWWRDGGGFFSFILYKP